MRVNCLISFVLWSMALAVPAFPIESTQAASSKQEMPLSNSDVARLVKLQLGDEVVIAKIKHAGEVAFDLTTDGLIQLKQAGVSGRVISAMLEKTTPAPQAVSERTETGAADGRDDVRIVIAGKEVRLPSNRGDLSATGFWPVVFTFLDYPGLRARTRTGDVRPTLIIHSEHDPKNYYYLARLDVNDEEDNNRSLKIEQKASGFSATTRVVPAGRWHVEYDATEKTAGVWRINPTRDLEAGEYGVVVPGGILYEFGVD
jgi:hypothetical protein